VKYLERNEIVIIGNGCAGAECIKALWGSGHRAGIHLFTDSRWPIYNPMLTTYYAAGKISFERLFPWGQSDEFYRRYGVTVHSGSPVTRLDAGKRVVANQAGLEINYSRCLIASGASPVVPPLGSTGSNRTYVMRTVEDALRLKEAIDGNPRKALVVGASLVGIKLTELFHNAGVNVCLVDLAEHLFPLNAHPDCAHIIENRLRQMGIKLRFGAGITRVEDTPGGIKADFSDDRESEEADLLVLGIGVKANLDFVDRYQVETRQGVLVDKHMETNISGLYAAGDASQGNNLLTMSSQIIGLWDNARYQGRTAGRNMAGIRDTYPGNIPHNITHFLGMDFAGIGDICQYDKMQCKHTNGRFQQLFWRDGRLTGANFLHTGIEPGIIKNAIIKGLIQNKPGNSCPMPGISNILIKRVVAEVEQA
jgi:NADPH-dependent 2,4-dienoyl-CoA reductase/sulfur reductase-like enzyme